jgi:hypothetical protein
MGRVPLLGNSLGRNALRIALHLLRTVSDIHASLIAGSASHRMALVSMEQKRQHAL